MMKYFKFSWKNFNRKGFRFSSTEVNTEEQLKKKYRFINRLSGAALAAVGGVCVLGAYLEISTRGTDMVVHPVQLPWFHSESHWTGYDVHSVRRGYQVYKQVCQACHSVMVYKYRHFVNQIMTEEEAKAEAAETMVTDGPNDEGKMFKRPGRLNDELPQPYENDVMAKLANNMAQPPDLMLITLARHGGEDYVFHLLTGYQEAPAGVTIGPGQAYNPYFPNGSVLSMSQQLFDDMITYEDGTPATQSQMAKDVTTFLKFLAEPSLPERKKIANKILIMSVPVAFILLYYKRFIFSTWKTQKVVFRTIKGREREAAPKR